MPTIDIPAPLTDNGWTLAPDGNAVTKTFKFKSFRAAMAFMVRASYEAEQRDHHPEWRNVYNRVEVVLTTHDTGGLTDKDFDLAGAMDACV